MLSDCKNSTNNQPPSYDPTAVNAAVHRTSNLPNGLRIGGGEAEASEFVTGGLVWACHHALSTDKRADHRTDRNFVQTSISLATAKKRLFFVDFAHDHRGLQAYPICSHSGNGLTRKPKNTHHHYIPIMDAKDPRSGSHPNYYPVRGQRFHGQVMKDDSYIDISQPYSMNSMERIDQGGYTSEEDARYVCAMADILRAHGRKETGKRDSTGNEVPKPLYG